MEWLEKYIYGAKNIIIVSVICSLLISLLLLGYGVYEIKYIIMAIINHDAQQIQLATLKVIDMFLFAIVLIIFSLGSYNLFISRLDSIESDSNNESKFQIPDWINVQNFSELKAIFMKVIVLILAILFLESIIQNKSNLFDAEFWKVLIIPIGMVLVAISLFLLEKSDSHIEK
jgi:uncharacterized protein (TIGR00645 family)